MYDKELDFAIETAQKAGVFIMSYYGKQNSPNWATPTNFKAEVDGLADMLIRTEMIKAFPDDDLYSEESDPLNRGNSRKWVYDPVDGTIPFVYHLHNNFGVSVGLVVGKKPVVGAVFFPARKEIYTAQEGRGAHCNQIPITVARQDVINRVVMSIDDGKETPSFRRDSMAPFWKLAAAPEGVTTVPRYACATAGLCQVASGFPNERLPTVGRLDAYLAGSLEPWDMAASVVIVREAGGKVTDLCGKEWELGDPSILAANPILHKKLLEYFKNESK